MMSEGSGWVNALKSGASDQLVVQQRRERELSKLNARDSNTVHNGLF